MADGLTGPIVTVLQLVVAELKLAQEPAQVQRKFIINSFHKSLNKNSSFDSSKLQQKYTMPNLWQMMFSPTPQKNALLLLHRSTYTLPVSKSSKEFLRFAEHN